MPGLAAGPACDLYFVILIVYWDLIVDPAV
jgi:hypothetical protein